MRTPITSLSSPSPAAGWATSKFPPRRAGYLQLIEFIAGFGTTRKVGVEGTSSYGAGLARMLKIAGVEFREVIRPRRAQRRRGKSDPLDAYAAAVKLR